MSVREEAVMGRESGYFTLLGTWIACLMMEDAEYHIFFRFHDMFLFFSGLYHSGQKAYSYFEACIYALCIYIPVWLYFPFSISISW